MHIEYLLDMMWLSFRPTLIFFKHGNIFYPKLREQNFTLPEYF